MALDTSTNWTTNPGSPVKNSKEDKSDSIPGGKYKAIKIIPKGNVSDMSRVDTEIKAANNDAKTWTHSSFIGHAYADASKYSKTR
jgi:hypothetical protein